MKIGEDELPYTVHRSKVYHYVPFDVMTSLCPRFFVHLFLLTALGILLTVHGGLIACFLSKSKPLGRGFLFDSNSVLYVHLVA